LKNFTTIILYFYAEFVVEPANKQKMNVILS